jgi:hypothetical protein
MNHLYKLGYIPQIDSKFRNKQLLQTQEIASFCKQPLKPHENRCDSIHMYPHITQTPNYGPETNANV